MAEKLTQIELDSIQLHETKPRSLAKDLNGFITQVSLNFLAVLMPIILCVHFIFCLIVQTVRDLKTYEFHLSYSQIMEPLNFTLK